MASPRHWTRIEGYMFLFAVVALTWGGNIVKSGLGWFALGAFILWTFRNDL